MVTERRLIEPERPAPSPGARPLLLSVLGDFVLPTGGHAWLGTLTDAMTLLGVAPASTRQSLRRLTTQGLLSSAKHGRHARYSMTPTGRRRFEEAADRIYLRRPLTWDGRWRLLSYAFTQSSRAARDALRRELEWLGYGALGAGLWACPWDHGTRLTVVLDKHAVTGGVQTFTSELHGDDALLAARAYDLPALRERHEAFIRLFSSEVLPAPVSREATETPLDEQDRLAFAQRALLLHEWRKFLFADPGLPEALLPSDWLGATAANLFRTRYAELEQRGWAVWDALASANTPDGQVLTARARASNLERPPPSEMVEDPASPLTEAPATPTTTSAAETDRRTEEFLAHIHGGGKVESGDWMPDQYRSSHIRFIEMHANSEIMGALPEREWIARAPTLRRKRSLAAKVQDEVGHAHLIYRVAESLGKPREQMFEDLIAGRTKFHNVFHYPTYSWGDVACIGFLVDGAAIVTQRALLDTSYLPYVRVMRRVVAEESLHYRHGEDIMLALATGSDAQFEMLQEAVNRWWEPTMHFFGTDLPRDKDALIHWGVKTRTNEESRQEFLTQYVPKLWDMGVSLPDPALRYDPDAKHWEYTEPDWDKLMAIVKGDPTPTTKTRLAWRRAVRRNHDWLHEVVTGDVAPELPEAAGVR